MKDPSNDYFSAGLKNRMTGQRRLGWTMNPSPSTRLVTDSAARPGRSGRLSPPSGHRPGYRPPSRRFAGYWIGPLMALSAMPCLTGQVLITRWDFSNASLTPQSGTGEARLVGGTSATFAAGHEGEASGGWNLKGFPGQGMFPGTAGAEFRVSTEGSGQVGLSFQLRHSNTSANTEQVLWSTDGVRFTEAARFTVVPAATGSGETWYDRSVVLPPEAAHQAQLLVRIVAAFGEGAEGRYLASRLGSSYSTSGTWRLDNVSFSAVPEPEEYAAISGLGLFGFALWRRARRAASTGTAARADSTE